MNHYLFVSPDNLDGSALESIEALDSVCDDFYSVALENGQQLAILLKLLSIDDYQEIELPESEDFESLIDLSSYKIPELSKEEFDELYDDWLRESGRESNMDEYGQLIFLHGQASDWNQRQNKVVLRARL
ncbi:MAG: hypothetical protein VB958_08955 [Thalassolituus sp.]|uniref:hypothetical protein n=1 Tax=Thalassolituus sp. TaxID=2030822 RepID=UPI003982AE87